MLFRSSWRRRSPWGLERLRAPIAAAPRLLTALLVATASATPAKPAAPEPVRNGQTLIVTAQDNGSSLILRQGETLQVVLSGNAGTGYGWDLEHHDPSRIKPLGMESRQTPGPPLPDGRSLPLAGGQQQISFCSACSGLAAARSSSATGALGKEPARSLSASVSGWRSCRLRPPIDRRGAGSLAAAPAGWRHN